MSARCYEHRFGYCTNVKACFNVHIGAILAKRRVLLGYECVTVIWLYTVSNVHVRHVTIKAYNKLSEHYFMTKLTSKHAR